MLEVNYVAKRRRDTYKPKDIGFNSFPRESLSKHGFLVLAILQRYRLVHQTFVSLPALHVSRLESSDPMGHLLGGPEPSELNMARPSLQYKYHFATETFVFQMRRALDSLVQFVELTNQNSTPARLSYDSIASVLHPQVDRMNEIYRIISGEGNGYVSDATGFLNVINDLFNSMKHCLLHERTQSLYCDNPETPPVISFYVKHNRLSDEEVFHNHNAFHLMMGFQDDVDRILGNLNVFMTRSVVVS